MQLKLLFFIMAGSLLGSELPEESELDGEDWYSSPKTVENHFTKAIYDKDLVRVEELLAARYDARIGLIYACQSFGCLRVGDGYLSSFFQSPSVAKELAIIKALVRPDVWRSSNHSFNFRYRDYQHPLDTLIASKSPKAMHVVHILLQAGPELYKYKDTYSIPLFRAVRNRNFSMVKVFLKFLLDHQTINDAFFTCMTMINEAQEGEDRSSLLLLGEKIVIYGIKNNFPQRFLDNSLYQACYWNVPEMVDFLLQVGADPYAEIEYKDAVVLEACKYSGKEVLQLFLDAGVDFHSKGKGGNGFLHIAAEGRLFWTDEGELSYRGNKEAVEFLLSNPRRQKELPLLAGLFD